MTLSEDSTGGRQLGVSTHSVHLYWAPTVYKTLCNRLGEQTWLYHTFIAWQKMESSWVDNSCMWKVTQWLFFTSSNGIYYKAVNTKRQAGGPDRKYVGLTCPHLGFSTAVPVPSWLPYSFRTHLLDDRARFWYHKMCSLLLDHFQKEMYLRELKWRWGGRSHLGKLYIKFHPEFSENLLATEGWRRHFRHREKAWPRESELEEIRYI